MRRPSGRQAKRRGESGKSEERRGQEEERIERDILTVGPSARVLSRVHSVSKRTDERRRSK
jgi:hypothetical protein